MSDPCKTHGPYANQKPAFKPVARPSWGDWHTQCPTCQTEWAVQQGIKRSGIAARFAGATVDNYRTPAAAQANALQACRSYLESVVGGNSGSLVLLGKVGTGKTHLACAIAIELMRQSGKQAYPPGALRLIRKADAPELPAA